MNIVHLTPGAGGMYCGGCFRDNALVGSLRHLGHDTLMIPLYLPLNLDEPDHSAHTPVFFGGINVYLEQKYPFFRKAPRWLQRLLASRTLLRRAGRAAAKTRPAEVGELTLSMLRGEDGNQARELAELIRWLKTQPRTDVICLSNALLIGMARQLKAELRAPIVCTFQGEDGFLDELPESQRPLSWQLLKERARDVDLFIAPTYYYGDYMQKRLGLPADKLRVVYNGINLDGYQPAEAPPQAPTVGFFARMCREKGLDILVEAFLVLKHRNRIPNLQLRLGGSLGPADQPCVDQLQARLKRNGFWVDTRLSPNVDRAGKIDFFRSLTVFSVPAVCHEAFGLYIIEALAAGVPVVLPRHASFPEIVSATGGGILFESNKPNALADALECLLRDPARTAAMGATGRNAVLLQFSIDRMAREMAGIYAELAEKNGSAKPLRKAPISHADSQANPLTAQP